MRILVVALLLSLFSMDFAQAQFNQCSPSSNSSEPRRSICKGGSPISGNFTRQFRNQRLQCSSNSDAYIRRAQNMSEIFHDWRDAGNGLSGKEKQKAMQDLAQERLPLINWSGRVPYQVVETWDWTECVYGQDYSCGTYQCNCSPTYDSKGNRTGESCSTCVHSCWHNQSRSESRHCSNEVLTYDAKYVRPSKTEWNPDSPGYYDVLPNKYDLLPAEVESVQIFSNGSFSPELAPTASIGDAWNKYALDIRLDTYGASVRCEDKVDRHARLTIKTIERKLGKKTPNAFNVVKGQDPLEYSLAVGRDGKEQNIKPVRVKLVDVASSMITAMSEQSREFEAERLAKKNKLGTDSNTSQAEQEKEIQTGSFSKSTKVRVRLFRDRLGRDRKVTENYETNDVKSVQYNSEMKVSDSSEDRLSDYWELDLDGEETLYRPSSMLMTSIMSNFKKNLAPDTRYKIMISMFQEGVPFYAQSCVGIACIAPVRDWRQNSYFSKELIIPFRTGNVDQRNIWEKLNDWHGEKWQWLRFEK